MELQDQHRDAQTAARIVTNLGSAGVSHHDTQNVTIARTVTDLGTGGVSHHDTENVTTQIKFQCI